MHLLVAHYRPDVISGAELAIADFVDQVSPQLKITMLVPGRGSLSSFYQEKGYTVWVKRYSTKRRRYPGLHMVQSLFLARELKNWEVDAVLCNTFAAASRVGTGSWLAHLPYAIYVREYIRGIPLHRKILSKANRVITVSQDVQRYISDMVDPDRTPLCYDPIYAQPIIERRKRHRAVGERLLPFMADGPVIGLVGRITPFKQQHLFIQSIPEVLKVIPEARFVIVGASKSNEQSYEISVRRLAVELGIENKVIFMGARSDAIELMDEITILCVTSSREPLGRVILEAQVVGCPVIVPDAGGPPELVKDGWTGLLFSSTAPDAYDQLAKQIIRLLQDENLRKNLAAKAEEQVKSTFASYQPVQHLKNELELLSQESSPPLKIQSA